MSSSSTEASCREPRFLSVDRGSVTRLAVVLVFAAVAFVGPFLGSTSAQFSDSTQLEVTFSVPAPVPPVDPDPEPVP